jgi:hypothetical protein
VPMDDNAALVLSVSRLNAFRQSWNAGDVICDECGLTADDLDRILARLEEVRQVAGFREMSLSEVHKHL